MEFPSERIQIALTATDGIHEHPLSACEENKHTDSTEE